MDCRRTSLPFVSYEKELIVDEIEHKLYKFRSISTIKMKKIEKTS